MKKLFSNFGHKVLSLVIASAIICACLPIFAATQEGSAPDTDTSALSAGSQADTDTTDETSDGDSDDGDSEAEIPDGDSDDGSSDSEITGGDSGDGSSPENDSKPESEPEDNEQNTGESGQVQGIPEGYEIIRFEPLTSDIKIQTVALGTPVEDLILPGELIAVISDGGHETDTAVEVAAWQSEPEYDSGINGTYEFTPDIQEAGPDGSVQLPVIRVNVGMMRRFSGLLPVVTSIKDANDRDLNAILSTSVTDPGTGEYTITFTGLPANTSIMSAVISVDDTPLDEANVSISGNTITVTATGWDDTTNIAVTGFEITVTGAVLETVPMWSDTSSAGVGVLNIFTLPAGSTALSTPAINYSSGRAAPGTAVIQASGRSFYRVDTFSLQNSIYTVSDATYTYEGIAAKNKFNLSGITPAFKDSGEYVPLKEAAPLIIGNKEFRYRGPGVSGSVRTVFNDGPWSIKVHNGGSTGTINSGLLVWATTKQVAATGLTEIMLTLYNQTDTPISNTNLSIDSDVMIGNDDRATINPLSAGNGFHMESTYIIDNNVSFVLINDNANKYGGETAPNWWGLYSDRHGFVNNDAETTTPVSGLDTGAVAKVRGVSLAPGALRTYSFLVGTGDYSAIIGTMELLVSGGTSDRISVGEARIGFTTNKAGKAYYRIQESGEAPPVQPSDPENDASWTPIDSLDNRVYAGGTIFTVNGLSDAGKAYDVYVVVITADDEINEPYKIPVNKIVQWIDTAEIIDITPPAAGNAPDYDATAANPTGILPVASGDVIWSPAVPAGQFLTNTVYTVTVKLTADNGYAFANTLTAATINGKPAVVSGNNGETVTLSYTFAETGELSGEITSAEYPVNVKLMLGGTYGTLIAETNTDMTGNYYFAAIPYGAYNLVATNPAGVKVTRLIVIKKPQCIEDIVMPDGNQNTVVEIKGSNTPSVSAGNLESMFSQQDRLDAQTDSVTITLVVEEVQTPGDDADIIAQNLKNGQLVGMYLDAKLLISKQGAGQNIKDEPIQPPDGTPLEMVITLPQRLWGHSNYSIIRVHNKKAAIISADPDSDIQTLAFEADKFSTYAIVYEAGKAPAPPTFTPVQTSTGSSGSSSPLSSYWIEVPEAQSMVKYALEKQQDYARSRRGTITGIRKDSLLTLAKAGLTYQHDTTSDNAVQVRVYIDNPGEAVKDILVSGYVKGDMVEAVKSRVKKSFPSEVAVISMEQQGNFGIRVHISANVDLSGMDVNTLYFYSYDRKTGEYANIPSEYRVDSKGYLYIYDVFLAGDIIVSDSPLAGSVAQPGVQNPTTGGYDIPDPFENTDAYIPDSENGIGGDLISVPAITGQESSASLQSADIAIQPDNQGAVKVEDLGTKVALIPNEPSDSPLTAKPSGIMIVFIILVSMIVAVLLWAFIPRKGDQLVPVEEYRKLNRKYSAAA